MKFFVVIVSVFVLGVNAYAQEVADVEEKPKRLSLVELIVESLMVYQLTEVTDHSAVWDALAGGSHHLQIKPSSPKYSFTEERVQMIKQYLESAAKNKTYSAGNFTIYFWDIWSKEYEHSYYFNLWNYTGEFYQQNEKGPLPKNQIVFPKYDELRNDLIWLCRNRYLLKLLKKGELTTEVYHLSPRQLQLLVKLCPQDWLKNLHAYAKSEKNNQVAYVGTIQHKFTRTKLNTLYQFLDYDPVNSKKYPLLDEEVVRKLANAIEDEIVSDIMFNDLDVACEGLNEKLKKSLGLTLRDRLLLRSACKDKILDRSQSREVLRCLKDRILKKGEMDLLKIYLQRVERRQSLADLLILAEFAHSKIFLEGKPEFQSLIMEQFALRKEKEAVWILAPILKCKDQKVVKQAKVVMRKFTSDDLGDDPEKWRAWYTEKNK